MLLLNPGPVSLTERVRRSLLQPDLCHRESEYYDLQDEARERLTNVYRLDPSLWTAVLVTASGTAAVESMIASLVPDSGKLLVIDNGVYGDRIAQIAGQYRIRHEVLKQNWMDAPDLDRLAQRLEADPGFTHVAAVHHETTTGRLNDLTAIDAICRAHGARLLVDGVSSFGAEAIGFDDGCIDAVAATANKCLHGVPGLSFVIARREAIERGARRAFYLDLTRLATMQAERGTPFTPAVQACYALVEALREFEDEGGLQARHDRYAALSEQLRTGLARLGIQTVLPVQESSVVLRSYRLPPAMSYAPLHDGLKARGFVIYAGQGNLAADLFRISTMGDIHRDDIDRLIEGFASLLDSRSVVEQAA